MVNIKNIQVDSAKGHIFDKNCPENKENILKLEDFVELDEQCGKTNVLLRRRPSRRKHY